MNSVESFLTSTEEQKVVKAIKEAERDTSGEIRVHIEKISHKITFERAKEVFFELKMDQTKDRNAVLLYIATESHQFAILGDEGINKVVPVNFWEKETQMITSYFAQNKNCEALEKGIEKVGKKLKKFFPYKTDDINELTNEISKG
jgi:uncharacterized membrane protein